MERPPRLWCFLCCDWLGLSWRQCLRWWQALRRAQRSRAVALRSAVLCSQALPQTSTALDHLVHHTLTPRGLVEALEALVREGGRLRRAQATQIEEAILRHTTATGQWQAEPDGSPPPVHA